MRLSYRRKCLACECKSFYGLSPVLVIVVIFSMVSCGPFSQSKVSDYQMELNNLVQDMAGYPDGIYDRDEIDEFIIDQVRNLDIDYIVKNVETRNPDFDGFFEATDSLFILIKSSSGIRGTEKRIIYDFNKNPHNYGDKEIKGAAYTIVQINERWYYAEVGFD